jgi:hypothetical protein
MTLANNHASTSGRRHFFELAGIAWVRVGPISARPAPPPLLEAAAIGLEFAHTHLADGAGSAKPCASFGTALAGEDGRLVARWP